VVAYALIDDLLALFETEPKAARQPRLESLLETARDELNRELGGLDYFRHPTSGSRTWVVDGSGCDLLHQHRGLAEVTTVEISLDYGATYIALESTDWETIWDMTGEEEPPDGEPWFHIRLLPYATFRAFPKGPRTVRLTGASGWPVIPQALVEGNANRARQLAFADASYQGTVPADDAYGQPIVTTRWPDVTWKFIQRESRRFAMCET